MKTNKQIKSFYEDNKLAIWAAGALIAVWRFWGVLGGLLGIVKSPLEAMAAASTAATASVKTSAQAATDKNTIKAALPANPKGYQASAADTVRYRGVAEQLAVSLGTMKGQLRNVVFTDDAGAYSAIKPYGKQSLGPGGLALVTRTGLPVLRPITGRYDYVIAPFYKELTGSNLQTDLDAAFPASPGWAASAAFKARCNFYRKHIRV